MSLVVPCYNEHLDIFRQCLESIVRQTHQPDRVFVIDDASADDSCYRYALAFASGMQTWTIHRFRENKGKRAAHQWALSRYPCDLLMNLDSDTVLDENALQESLRPFANEKIQGVCGTMTALNASENWITRFMNFTLVSQDFDRASQAAIDSVIAPGRFHVFRTSILDKYSSEYFDETFMGRHMKTGEDATLSRLGTRVGRVFYQSTCRAQTRVVSTVREFLLQFVRWERNTLQYLTKGLMEYSIFRPVYWLSAVDLFLRLGFGGLLAIGVIHDPLVALKIFVSFYVVFVLVLLKARPAGNWLELSMTGVAPFLKALQLIILWPLRLYALVTIRRDRWGTR